MKNIIIILNYNDSDNCLKYYNMIKDYNTLNEIIFVDNNSNDIEFSKLNSIKDKNVTILKSTKNKGYAHGNNVGIKYAVDKYKKCNIIISNPDIEISEESLNGLINTLNNNKEISVISPTIIEGIYLNRGWKLPDSIDELKLSIPGSNKRRNKIIGYEDKHYKGEYSKVDVISGSFFIIKSKEFKDVNYFDENTFLYYEENILCKKLKEKNYSVYVSNIYKAKHNHSVSIDKNKKYIEKFDILKKSQKYYINNYLHTNIFIKLLINMFAGVTRFNIKVRRIK